jgi:hypothetical protein
MLKTIGIALGLAMIPGFIDKASEAMDDLYDYFFEPEVAPDNSLIFTKQRALFIRYHHEVSDGTDEQHAEFFNDLFNWDKSLSTYACIWKKTFDVDSLPEGTKVNA